MIDGGEIIGMMAVFGIFVVPSIGLTARFALKPIVESVLRVREALDRQRPLAEDPRVTTLQQEITELRETVDRLSAAAEFDAQLRAGGGSPVPRPASLPVPGSSAQPLPPEQRETSEPMGDSTDYAQEYE